MFITLYKSYLPFFVLAVATIMPTDRLHDAALALHQILGRANIKYGVFGGYAVSVLGGVRESKDVDCLASVTKNDIIKLLDGTNGFTAIPQTREDYVGFFWSEPGKGSAIQPNSVLVEIFCDSFPGMSKGFLLPLCGRSELRAKSNLFCPGAQYSMTNVRTVQMSIKGASGAVGTCSYLEPFLIFKGKLCAAATRNKFHDTADLRKIGEMFEADIRARAKELQLDRVGLAIKRNAALELLFTRLGVDTEAAKAVVANIDPDRLEPAALGDVQAGLLS